MGGGWGEFRMLIAEGVQDVDSRGLLGQSEDNQKIRQNGGDYGSVVGG